jgi:hypothetical protein
MGEVNCGSSSSGSALAAVAALALVMVVIATGYLLSQRRDRRHERRRVAPAARPGCGW